MVAELLVSLAGVGPPDGTTPASGRTAGGRAVTAPVAAVRPVPLPDGASAGVVGIGMAPARAPAARDPGPDPAERQADTDPARRAGDPLPPPGSGVPAPGAGYAWPLLPTPTVLTPFRAPTHAYGPGHRGVDLAGFARQPVLAARAGSVVFAGQVAGHGVVSVQHDDGLRTTYEPLSPTVAAGAVVRAGDVIGLLAPGHAGCPAAVCLHWGVRRDRLDYLDPLVLLRAARVRLLPVPDPWPDGDPPSVAEPGSGRVS